MPLDYFEDEDLPNTLPITFSIGVGDRFLGFLNNHDPSSASRDGDFIGFDVPLGDYTNYIYWLSSEGAHSFEEVSVASYTSNGSVRSDTSGTIYWFTADDPDEFWVEILDRPYRDNDGYVLNLAYNTLIDEIFDAPADISTTYSMDVGGTFDGILGDTDVDWISVTLEAGRVYQIGTNDTWDIWNFAEVHLNFYDANGVLVQLGNRGHPSPIHYQNFINFEESGQYFIEVVDDTSSSHKSAYQVEIADLGPLGLVELGDAPGGRNSPYSIEPGDTFSGFLDPGDYDGITADLEADWVYKVTVTVPETDEFHFAGNTILQVYNESFGLALLSQAAYDYHTEGLFFAHKPAEHLIRIWEASGYYSGNYAVTLEAVQQVHRHEKSDAANSANTLLNAELGAKVRGYLSRDDKDWIRIEIDAPGWYSLSAKNFGPLELDHVAIDLLDADSNYVSIQEYYTWHEAFVEITDPGTYYVRLNSRDEYQVGLWEGLFQLYDHTINGTAGDDEIRASDTYEVIYGYAGDDTLNSRDGDDTLFGGDGNDGLGGGDGNDQIRGGRGNDGMNGQEGHDLLIGDRGNDTMWGEGGNDSFVGGYGADYMLGGQGLDYLTYEDAPTRIVLDLENAGRNIGWAFGDTVGSIEQLRGSSHADSLWGNWHRNVFRGNDGADLMSGRGGNDLLIGGRGNDTLNGNLGNDDLQGGGGNDILDGGIGNDTLLGGAGNDTLIGGAGNDLLTGDAGADVFRFSGGDGDDTITGFNAAEDIIRFDAPAFTPLVTTSAPLNQTIVEYGIWLVRLDGVLLTASDITFEFV